MKLTRDHLERLIIDRILIDSPEGRRTLYHNSASSDSPCPDSHCPDNNIHHNSFSNHENSTGQVKPDQVNNEPKINGLISASANFASLTSDRLRLDERLPHTLLKPIAARIKLIAERYTNLREKTIPALTAEECRAYACYYSLINMEKTARLLADSIKCTSTVPLRVLDYGCGPGTAALALTTLREAPFALVAIDSNPSMRKIAHNLLTGLSSTGSLTSCEVLSPESQPQGVFDLVIIGHVLNEMPAIKQEDLLKGLLKHLSPSGTLIILESALLQQTRELMQRRDFLLSYDQSLNVTFPCTQQGRCKMLTESPTDWCHGTMHWDTPHLVRQFDALTGFNKHALKYSGLVLKRGVKPSREISQRYRVVAPPEQNKAGHCLTICGQNFFGRTSLRKSARNDDNIELRRANHYDILEMEGTDLLGREFPATLKVSRVRAP